MMGSHEGGTKAAHWTTVLNCGTIPTEKQKQWEARGFQTMTEKQFGGDYHLKVLREDHKEGFRFDSWYGWVKL